VWTFGIVFLAVPIAKYSCFEQVTEDFSAEQFVPERAIEAFDVAVFPGSTGRDEPSLDIEVSQVAPDCISDELRPVVAPDKGRGSALSYQSVQHVDNIGRRDRSIDFESETFTGMLIDDRHPLEPPAIGGGVEEKVVAPNMIRERGPQPNATIFAASDSPPFSCFPAMREPILAPEAVHSLGIDLLSVSS
jgi:hypothetical protein